MRKRTPLEEDAFRLKIDIPIGRPTGTYTEFTEEEKKKHRADLLKLIERYENVKKE